MREKIRKLIDELRRDADEELAEGRYGLHDEKREYAQRLESAIRPQWVPVTERLPRYGQRVFVINRMSDGEEEIMLAASYQYDDGKQWFMDVQTGFQFEGVTHWHEIEAPEPPEKQL